MNRRSHVKRAKVLRNLDFPFRGVSRLGGRNVKKACRRSREVVVLACAVRSAYR